MDHILFESVWIFVILVRMQAQQISGHILHEALQDNYSEKRT